MSSLVEKGSCSDRVGSDQHLHRIETFQLVFDGKRVGLAADCFLRSLGRKKQRNHRFKCAPLNTRKKIPRTKAESKMMLFQNPFQDGPDGNAIRVLSTIGRAISGLIIGGLLIQAINIDAGTADIIELIIMLLGCCGGFLVGDPSQSRAARAVPKSNQELERTRAALDYIIILGLMVTLAGAFLQFIIPDWRLLLTSAGGMLLVVIALWYGRNLKQP
jgi:hypothetical protein